MNKNKDSQQWTGSPSVVTQKIVYDNNRTGQGSCTVSNRHVDGTVWNQKPAPSPPLQLSIGPVTSQATQVEPQPSK